MAMFADPWRLLLADALGASATCLVTALLLAPGHVPTGLPAGLLFIMAAVAGLFVCAALAGRLAADPRRPLAAMAILNTAYCAVMVIACVVHAGTLTTPGVISFGAEVVVMIALVSWELKVALRRPASGIAPDHARP